MAEEDLLDIIKKMDKKLVILLNTNLSQKDQNVKEKVAYLAKFDLEYNEIAQILGISPSHAAKELSNLKKGGG
jgi:DNA-binding Lrp family transcriptional regulator